MTNEKRISNWSDFNPRKISKLVVKKNFWIEELLLSCFEDFKCVKKMNRIE
jgi:hypothetical protein